MNDSPNVAWWVGHLINDVPAEAFDVAITAGMGAGKSFGAVQYHWYLTRQVNRKSPLSLFVEPTSYLCKYGAIPIWQKFFQQTGMQEGLDYQIVMTYPQTITFPATQNNVEQKVLFLSGDKPSSIVNYTVSHATLDEPGQMDREAKSNTISRIRCPEAALLRLIESGTPEGDDNHYAEDFDIPPLTLQDNKYRIQVHTRDNIFNPRIDQYIANLEQTWAHSLPKLTSYLAGEFSSFGTNNVFTHWNKDALCDISIDVKPDQTIYLSFDFNAFPLAWVAGQVNGEEFHFCACSDGLRRINLADQVALILDEVFPARYYANTEFAIFGDRTGHADSHKTDLSDYQTIQDVFLRKNRICRIFTPTQVVPIAGSVDVIERYFSRRLIKSHPRCVKLIDSFRKTKWKENSRVIEKPQKDDWTHWSDAARYLIYFLDKWKHLSWKVRSLSIPTLSETQKYGIRKRH